MVVINLIIIVSDNCYYYHHLRNMSSSRQFRRIPLFRINTRHSCNKISGQCYQLTSSALSTQAFHHLKAKKYFSIILSCFLFSSLSSFWLRKPANILDLKIRSWNRTWISLSNRIYFWHYAYELISHDIWALKIPEITTVKLMHTRFIKTLHI